MDRPPHSSPRHYTVPDLPGYPVARLLGSYFENRPRWQIVVLGALATIALAAVDFWLSSQRITFLVFYLAPVFIFSWFIGWRAGLVSALVCTVLNFSVDLWHVDRSANPAAPFITGFTGFLVYLVTARVVSVMRALMEHERDLARTDHVTGAANRRAFYQYAEVELYRARRRARPLTLVMLDLDNFKAVNDALGHHTGDRVLRVTAETLQRGLRATDLVARLGGDEFAILLPETDSAAAGHVIERLHSQLAGIARANNWPITLSMGVVTFTAPPASVDDMLKPADQLMYAAKGGGKNSIRRQTV